MNHHRHQKATEKEADLPQSEGLPHSDILKTTVLETLVTHYW